MKEDGIKSCQSTELTNCSTTPKILSFALDPMVQRDFTVNPNSIRNKVYDFHLESNDDSKAKVSKERYPFFRVNKPIVQKSLINPNVLKCIETGAYNTNIISKSPKDNPN